MDWRAKIIINFSDFSIVPMFIIFIIKLGANFSSFVEISIFFQFYSFFGFIHKKISDFSHKLGIWRIKSEKVRWYFSRKADFSHKSGKLANPILDDYYINCKNAKIQKIYDNLCKNLDEKSKIIINFLGFVLPILIIFIFKLDTNFPSLL